MLDKVNKSGVSQINFKTSKNICVKAIAFADNNVDYEIKVTNSYITLESLTVTTFAATNCIINFYLAVSEKKFLSAAFFTFNYFHTIFSILANKTL